MKHETVLQRLQERQAIVSFPGISLVFNESRAMNEVRVERMIQNYKECGELDSEDPALVMLKQWPASTHYKDRPNKPPGPEKLVCYYYVK